MDPAICPHTEIKKSAKIETISVPELGIEQLFLRVRVFCKDCKSPFVPKTLLGGFSTEEVGVVDDELFVPLEYPLAEEFDASEMEPLTSDAIPEGQPTKEKHHLH